LGTSLRVWGRLTWGKPRDKVTILPGGGETSAGDKSKRKEGAKHKLPSSAGGRGAPRGEMQLLGVEGGGKTGVSKNENRGIEKLSERRRGRGHPIERNEENRFPSAPGE